MADEPVTESAPRRARDIARAALVADITATARRHVAEQGASALSLRAVSRDLGMASSAIYRYFPSRDALLTQLIIDAYNALADACDAAHDAVDPADLVGRFRAVAHGVRDWARANPHEYALIYGSPVPGYAAPEDTIDPATRIPVRMLTLLAEIEHSGQARDIERSPVGPELLAQLDALAAVAESSDHRVSRSLLLAGFEAWVMIFGMVSFELFGQFVNTFDDADHLFAHQVDTAASRILASSPNSGSVLPL